MNSCLCLRYSNLQKIRRTDSWHFSKYYMLIKYYPYISCKTPRRKYFPLFVEFTSFKELSPKTPQEDKDMRRFSYALAVRSLMYTQLCNSFEKYCAVGIISCFQSNCGPNYRTTIKNPLKYFKRMRNHNSKRERGGKIDFYPR